MVVAKDTASCARMYDRSIVFPVDFDALDTAKVHVIDEQEERVRAVDELCAFPALNKIVRL